MNSPSWMFVPHLIGDLKGDNKVSLIKFHSPRLWIAIRAIWKRWNFHPNHKIVIDDVLQVRARLIDTDFLYRHAVQRPRIMLPMEVFQFGGSETSKVWALVCWRSRDSCTVNYWHYQRVTRYHNETVDYDSWRRAMAINVSLFHGGKFTRKSIFPSDFCGFLKPLF